jgi:hypothetical protein
MNAAAFEQITQEAFSELERSLGFWHVPTTSTGASHTVVFRNATTEVAVNFEIGVPPWVEVAEASIAGRPDHPRGRIGLDVLLIYLGVRERPNHTNESQFIELTDQQLSEALASQAALLYAHAGALLAGDFSIMAPVQVLAYELLREAERTLYGERA